MSDGADKLRSANSPWEDVEINGSVYRVTRLGWWAMLDALHRLEEVLGPSLVSLLSGSGGDLSIDGVLDAVGPGIGEALTGLLRRATDKGGRALLELLGAQTIVLTEDGRKLPLDKARMDVWFSQHPGDAVPWIGACLRVQYADFFAPLLAAMRSRGGAGEGEAAEETSPAES